jgi:hypothetical protein
LQDGSHVIGWIASDDAGAAPHAFVRRFGTDGSPAGARVSVGNSANEQLDLQFTALPDGSFLVAWAQRNAGGTFDVLARRFDAALNPLGAEQTLQASANSFTHMALAVASRPDGTTLVAWTPPSYSDVWWQLLDAHGAPIGGLGSARIRLSDIVDTIDAVPSASGFTLVVESTLGYSRGANGTIVLVDVDATGVWLGNTEVGARTLRSVSPTTGAWCGTAPSGVAAAGGPDGRYMLAYESCSGQNLAQVEVLAR